ncbi:MAG: cobalt-precorrin-5B (C(1))-methyltransferase CbiD [Clostridiales bacterium]|jgi:cobalt-precorrin-5B (C1)-methyltransferase|nr:cobalt-precorrin-5B (C(1))-methyltransferase CbiD [Clostridiales bacterium]
MGVENLHRNVNGKLLRCGYTTGSCAAAASKAAAVALLSGELPGKVSIATPKGIALTLDVLELKLLGGAAVCAVLKDSGGDPDVTDGVLVYAAVTKTPGGITIEGGDGVGRVTKPGLDQPVGEWAINSKPREMIAAECEAAAKKYGYAGGFNVTVSVPNGAELAKKTFNPRMGIEGGISIIGTTGIVEPMSHAAMADSIRLEIKQLRLTGATDILLTPGRYGEDFTRNTLKLPMEHHVMCSNFIGDALDCAVEQGFNKILLVGHAGKLVKLGIGITNTHSAFGDGRMETLMACVLAVGADIDLMKSIAECVTTDAALTLIEQAGLLKAAAGELSRRVENTLTRRVPESVDIAFICFWRGKPYDILCRGGFWRS